MYLSPLVTSELFRGLKRHITLMVHSAGSAIFHGWRMEIHRYKKKIKIKYILDARSGRWGKKGGRAPLDQRRVLERAIDRRLLNESPCFPHNHFPLQLRSHDTGGWAAAHPACCRSGCGSQWRHPDAPSAVAVLVLNPRNNTKPPLKPNQSLVNFFKKHMMLLAGQCLFLN